MIVKYKVINYIYFLYYTIYTFTYFIFERKFYGRKIYPKGKKQY